MDTVETKTVGELEVRVVYDEDGSASNPRTEQETLSRIYGSHRRYTIGDGEPPSDHADALERGGFRLLARYLRMSEGAVAIRGVGLYDHSGVSYYTFDVPGGNPKAPREWPLPQGHRDWDSGGVGYAYITGKRWAELVGDESTEKAEAAIDAEVKEYGAWANGEVYGYQVIRRHCDDADCPHNVELESCYGFIGDVAYVMTEGVQAAETIGRGSGYPAASWPVDHAEGE